MTVERVRSANRRKDVELIVMRPEDAEPELPVCLALHGRDQGASMFVDLGVPEILTSIVNYQGIPPFAVVAMDGGDSYWVAQDDQDDPQAMLTEDVPTWLTQRGLVNNPFAVVGISMGGYGALNYAGNLNDPAVAAISPALFLSWPEAESREAFVSEDRWRQTDPLQNMSKFSGVPLGMWCGESDPFVDGARQLAENADVTVAEFEPGGHDDAYWRKVLPDALKFIGNRIG